MLFYVIPAKVKTTMTCNFAVFLASQLPRPFKCLFYQGSLNGTKNKCTYI